MIFLNGINIKLLKQFVKNDTEYTSTTICNSLNITNIDEVENSLEELLELGLIKIAHKDILYTSYKLTPTGRDYFKNKPETILSEASKFLKG